MTVPQFIKEAAGGIYLFIKVQPRASKNEIRGMQGNELKISITAPPVDSAANQALIEFMARQLNCSRSAIQIAKGNTSRHKTLFVSGVSAVNAANKLQPK